MSCAEEPVVDLRARPGESTPRGTGGHVPTLAVMHPRLVAMAVFAVALVGCDAATATAPIAPTADPAAAPPRTNPPATGAKVSILPATFGPLGSGFLLQLNGFGAGTKVTETVTNPLGVPKSALLTMNADGSGSATFQTSLNDQQGVGRYTFRFDAGTISITTFIDVTRP
jgi:hypothetical protein